MKNKKLKLKTKEKKLSIIKNKIKPAIETEKWKNKHQRETEKYIDMIEKYLTGGKKCQD